MRCAGAMDEFQLACVACNELKTEYEEQRHKAVDENCQYSSGWYAFEKTRGGRPPREHDTQMCTAAVSDAV